MNRFSLEDFINSYKPKNTRFFTIVIDGRGASGKSVLADYIQKLLPDFVVLHGDAVYQQALAAGATAVIQMTSLAICSRVGRVCDPFGNLW